MKQNEHALPSAAALLDIDNAIRKRSGRGGLNIEKSSTQSREITSDNSHNDDSRSSTANPQSQGLDDERGYEYLDHTADIQLHAWNTDLAGSLEQLVLAMFGYMTSLEKVEIDPEFSCKVGSKILSQGHDLQSLIFNFLDEWLFIFHSTYFIVKEIRVEEIDLENYKIRSSAKGEKIDVSKHPQGTEIKAITYSNMQVVENASRCDVWVIVDI